MRVILIPPQQVDNSVDAGEAFTGGAVNRGRPPRSASNVVADAVFDGLGLA
jgi:hypothetical protein